MARLTWWAHTEVTFRSPDATYGRRAVRMSRGHPQGKIDLRPRAVWRSGVVQVDGEGESYLVKELRRA